MNLISAKHPFIGTRHLRRSSRWDDISQSSDHFNARGFHSVKFKNLMLVAAIGISLISVFGLSQNKNAGNPAGPFLGSWDLTLKAPDREYPSWLDIKEEDGQLKARMVGR